MPATAAAITPEVALRRPLSEVASVVAPMTVSVPPTLVLPEASMLVVAEVPNARVAPEMLVVDALVVELVRAEMVLK